MNERRARAHSDLSIMTYKITHIANTRLKLKINYKNKKKLNKIERKKELNEISTPKCMYI